MTKTSSFKLVQSSLGIFGVLMILLSVGEAHADSQSPAPLPGKKEAPSESLRFHYSEPRMDRLPNGLEVVWFQDDSLPLIDLALLVKSGHRSDPAGKSGTAQLTADLLERGAAGQSAVQIAEKVEQLGGTLSVSADADHYTLMAHGLAEDTPAFLKVLSQVAIRPDFPKNEFELQKKKTQESWKHLPERGDALASLAQSRILTSGTSYGRGSLSSLKEFAKVTREDVQSFHATHFVPENAVLMIIGRADPESMLPKVKELFGSWKGKAPKPVFQSWSQNSWKVKKGKRVYLVDRPELNQAQVRIGLLAPSLRSSDHEELMVGNALLGGYFHSRLNTVIRDQLGLTYGIRSSFSFKKEFASWSVSTSTRNEEVVRLLKNALSIIKDVCAGKIEAREVITAKDYLKGRFPLRMATLNSIAAQWLSGRLYGLPEDYLATYLERVDGVSLESVTAAMKKGLDPSQSVIVVAGDAKKLRPLIQKAGYSITQLKASELF